ncbi:MAG: acyl-CoA desaturase [Archangiaceae bacterium]|nr:acyl-CoA desaturase [Archangiaceae bacterium]
MSTAARYLPHGPFHAALSKRVDEYFARTGQSPRQRAGMRLKTATLFCWLLASYLYALLFAHTWWQVALACMSLGFAMAGIGFGVQHDGSHRAYADGAGWNALAAGALDAIGASSYVWAWKHNVFHHSNPNCVGLDADIDIQPFCRLAPGQPRRPWHRFQHLYVWLLYSLLAMKWLFDDFRDVANGTIGGQHFPRPRGWQLVQLVGGKVFFLGWSLGLPMLLHPVGNVMAAWVLASVTISLVMACTFQMAHVVERTTFTKAGTGEKSRWAEHQVATTADFGQGNALLTWYTGALNFQIEHHLFPKVCHLHLPALAPIVKATCEEFGVPYVAYPSAKSALVSHARWLKSLGAVPHAEALTPATG